MGIDRAGNIHATDGRFAGNVTSEPTIDISIGQQTSTPARSTSASLARERSYVSTEDGRRIQNVIHTPGGEPSTCEHQWTFGGYGGGGTLRHRCGCGAVRQAWEIS